MKKAFIFGTKALIYSDYSGLNCGPIPEPESADWRNWCRLGRLWVRHLGDFEINQDWRVWCVYWVLCWVVLGTCCTNLTTGVHFSHTVGCLEAAQGERRTQTPPGSCSPALCGFILKALKTAALQFRQHFPGMKKRKSLVPARFMLYQENNLPWNFSSISSAKPRSYEPS